MSDFCSPPGSSVHEIPQARILEWVAIPFSRGSSPPRDQTWVSRIAGRFFTIWATRETKLAKCKDNTVESLEHGAGLCHFLTIVTLGKNSLFLYFFIFKIGVIVVKTSWYCREDYVIRPHRAHCHSSWDSRTGRKHHLGNCQKCRLSGLIPDPQNQNLHPRKIPRGVLCAHSAWCLAWHKHVSASLHSDFVVWKKQTHMISCCMCDRNPK